MAIAPNCSSDRSVFVALATWADAVTEAAPTATQVTLQRQDLPNHLTCQPLLLLAPPDTPYLPFDAAHDGYPFFNPAT